MFAGMIFDLDGVVADTHAIHRKAWRQFLLERGQQVSEEELDFVLEGHKRGEILRHFLGSLSAAEVSLYGGRKDELFYQSATELRPIPGVVDFLYQLENADVAKVLATSASQRRAQHVLERLGLADRFAAVVTGDDVSNGKPDPAIFQLAASRLHVPPCQLLVAEDSGAGVRAAKSAGMKCLGIGSGALASKLCQEGADRVVPDFTSVSVLCLQSLFPAEQTLEESPSWPMDGPPARTVER